MTKSALSLENLDENGKPSGKTGAKDQRDADMNLQDQDSDLDEDW